MFLLCRMKCFYWQQGMLFFAARYAGIGNSNVEMSVLKQHIFIGSNVLFYWQQIMLLLAAKYVLFAARYVFIGKVYFYKAARYVFIGD